MPRPTSPSIKLSPARRRWLETQVSRGRFSDLNQALNFCVQQAAQADATRAEFDKLISEGDAGPFERADERWWKELRAESAAGRSSRRRRKSA